MPSFFVPARDSRHRAACFALCRVLLRQVPHISLPVELTSRPGWINPIRYLILSGFRRNKTDTSPRLVTSALLSGYRILSLLTGARNASSSEHSELITFLLDRHRAFPPPRPPPPPPPVLIKNPPLLTKVSPPGEDPLYASTVRPLPLEQLSGGKRKIPRFDMAQSVPFLRIGKPQSHAHAGFLRVKFDRRQRRVTALAKMKEEEHFHVSMEDEWDAKMRRLAEAEGVELKQDGKGEWQGSYTSVWKEFGVDHLTQLLMDETADMQARAKTMLDIVDEEEKLAKVEKEESDERRRKAWEERVKLGTDKLPPPERAPKEPLADAELVDDILGAIDELLKNVPNKPL